MKMKFDDIVNEFRLRTSLYNGLRVYTGQIYGCNIRIKQEVGSDNKKYWALYINEANQCRTTKPQLVKILKKMFELE